jgi:NADP-dependent 3-hydroxy acid dehydrogenase YdfG
VNNAGLALGKLPADENIVEDVQTVINTNVTATISMSSLFLPAMRARSRGHLINIGSVAGHEAYPGGSVYNASKFAVTAFTYATRMDLVDSPVRVTCISPGMVSTEFSVVRFKGDQAKADATYEDIVAMNAADVADQVCYAATRPAHVQIADIISYATNQGGAAGPVARVGPSLGAKQ